MIRVMIVLLLVLPGGLAHAAEKPARPLEALVRLLQSAEDVGVQRDVLRGMADALAGRRNMAAPKGWSEVHRKLSSSSDAEVRDRVTALSVLFGDPQALALLRRTAEDTRQAAGKRHEALELLLDKRAEGVPAL